MIRMYTISFPAMGSTFRAWLQTSHDGLAILRQVPAWVEEIEAVLSRFRPESELSRLNTHNGKWVKISDTLLQAVITARRVAELTDGLCTPLVLRALLEAGYRESFADMDRDQHVAPDDEPFPAAVYDWRTITVWTRQSAIRLLPHAQLDLGGTGKGWTAAQIVRHLSAHGPCLVDAGGDIVARGKPLGKPGWEVNVAEPGASDDQPPLTTITLANAAVATSGTDYRRWTVNGKPQHHLIDPRTGGPAVTDVVSATVIHTDATLAEGFAKALVILGSQEGLPWLVRQPQSAALLVRSDGAVLATPDFQAHMLTPAIIP